MSAIAIGFVGFGYQGRRLFSAFSADRRFRVTKVMVRHPETLVAELGWSMLTNRIDEITNDKMIDAIVVATPLTTHYRIASYILSFKKHLLIEKRLTTNLRESSEILHIAAKNQCKVLVDYKLALSPAMDIVKDLVEAGNIGLVQGVHLTMKQLGRFNDSDVYTLLGSHMLAVLDRISPLNGLQFRCEDLIVRDGITESGMILFTDKSSPLNVLSGVIDVSLNYPDRERRITLYGNRGTISYDFGDSKMLKVVHFVVDRGVSDQPLSLKSDTMVVTQSRSDLQNVVSYFFDLLSDKKQSNLASSMEVDKILEALIKRA